MCYAWQSDSDKLFIDFLFFENLAEMDHSALLLNYQDNQTRVLIFPFFLFSE